jgi:hypothetical protein
MVAHTAGLFDCEFKNLLGAGGKIDLAAAVLAKTAHFFNHLAHPIRFQTKLTQDAAGDAAVFLDQAEEEVFGPDRILTKTLGLLVSQAKHTPRPLGKTFHSGHKYLLLKPTTTAYPREESTGMLAGG